MTYKVDLLCGPGPDELYRLTLGYGESGQAHVYQGHPVDKPDEHVTVRVWKRVKTDRRGVPEQQRSFRNGAKVLNTLYTARVQGICVPVRDFDAPAPWAPDSEPAGDEVPIQVLRWIDGDSL